MRDLAKLAKPKTGEIVEIKDKIAKANLNEKLPAHVWALMQQGGEQAAKRLNELLSSSKFNRLKGSEQINAIRLAFEYAYGKPDAPLKRSVSLNLTGDASDEVSAALERLAGRADLPEYRQPSARADDTAAISPSDDT